MRIIIETLPHDAQRYETCGDWETRLSTETGERIIEIKVSELKDWRMEALIGIHEAIEAVMCVAKGIDGKAVDKFDIEYEAERAAFAPVPDVYHEWLGGTITQDSEPGDHPAAPYGTEHCFATAVERMLAAALGIPWAHYEAQILEL